MTVRELVLKFMPDEIIFENADEKSSIKALEGREVKAFYYDLEEDSMQITLEDEHDLMLEVMAEMLFEKACGRTPTKGDEGEIALILLDLEYALDNVRIRREK